MKRKAWLATLTEAATPTIEECISYLGSHITLLDRLKSTPQDPEWHAEGDVFIHTGMVLEELYKLLAGDAHEIVGERRQALILGALLHDISKPDCTKKTEIRGTVRTVAPKHEEHGRSHLAFLLCDLKLSHYVTQEVLGLVGEHHRPKLLIARNQDKEEYLKLSRSVDVELVYWLEVADMKGRECPDLSSQLNHLEEFKLFCQEYEIWPDQGKESIHQQWRFSLSTHVADLKAVQQDYVYSRLVNDMERGLINVPEEALGKTYEHRNSFAQLVVLCGVSGSGKSTWIEKYLPDYTVVSLDNIRTEINGTRGNQSNRGKVIHQGRDRLKDALRKGKKVVWDATNVRYDFRKIVCDIGKDYHALVTLVVFQCSRGTLYQRNSKRINSIPEEIMDKQIASFQWPTPDEAHRFCIINDAGDLISKTGHYNDHQWFSSEY